MSGGRYSTLELKRRGLPLGRYHRGCSFGGGSSGRGVGYRRQLSRGTAGQPATVQRGPEGSRSACPLFLFCRWGLGACCISNTRTRNSAPTPSCEGLKARAKKHATLSSLVDADLRLPQKAVRPFRPRVAAALRKYANPHNTARTRKQPVWQSRYAKDCCRSWKTTARSPFRTASTFLTDASAIPILAYDKSHSQRR